MSKIVFGSTCLICGKEFMFEKVLYFRDFRGNKQLNQTKICLECVKKKEKEYALNCSWLGFKWLNLPK